MPANPLPPKPIDVVALREAYINALGDDKNRRLFDPNPTLEKGEHVVWYDDGDEALKVSSNLGIGIYSGHVAVLIPAAVNALPALLDRLERLEEVAKAAAPMLHVFSVRHDYYCASERNRGWKCDCGADDAENAMEAALAELDAALPQPRAGDGEVG